MPWKANRKITCPAWKSVEPSAPQFSADFGNIDASYFGPASGASYYAWNRFSSVMAILLEKFHHIWSLEEAT